MTDKIICYCKQVSEDTIVRAVRNGASDLATIKKRTGACTGSQCKELNPKGRCCSGDIEEIIRRETKVDLKPTCSCCGPKR